MRRRLGVLLLALAFGLSLTACEGKDKDKESIVVEESSSEEEYDENTPGKTKADSKIKVSSLVRDGSRLGELQQVTKSNVIEITGVVITGGREQGYPDFAELKDEDFSMQNKYNEYYLDESLDICVHMKEEKPLAVYLCPEKELTDESEISYNILREITEKYNLPYLSESVPYSNTNGYYGSIGMELSYDNDAAESGLYDLFFVCEDKIYYMMQLQLNKHEEGFNADTVD